MRFAAFVAVVAAGSALLGMSDRNQTAPIEALAVSHDNRPDEIVRRNGEQLFEEGRRVFRTRSSCIWLSKASDSAESDRASVPPRRWPSDSRWMRRRSPHRC